MNDTDCLFDDLLCRSLSLFHQFRLYDDCVEEDNAFKALREAEKIVSNTRNGICVAKLGCVIECLAHRFYIDDDTDGVLGEVVEASFCGGFCCFFMDGGVFLIALEESEIPYS